MLKDWILDWWCRLMHGSTSWPVHGRYRCWSCLREFEAPME